MNTTSIPIPPLEPQRGSSLVGKAYWVMLQRVTLIAAAIDVGYILLFMGLGSRPLAIVNFLSIAMYLGAYRLIQKRYNAAALVLIWVEVLGHAALGSLLIGWDSGFHYYLLLFIPAIVVANTRGYAAPMVLALLAYYLGLQALCSHWGPLDPLPVRSVQIVNWMHICLVFAMSAALAAVYRRTILIAGSRLRKQATQDPLTSLANRSQFEALAAHALARSQRDGSPVTLLLCDADLFKRINDQYGHAVGDAVLVAIANVLAANLRDGDVLARWGGDEFLLLLPDMEPHSAQTLLERTREAIAALPVPNAPPGLRLSMSAGLALHLPHSSPQETLERADQALYAAKDQGRNRVALAPELQPAPLDDAPAMPQAARA